MTEPTKLPPAASAAKLGGIPLFKRHVTVRLEIEAPADEVAGVFGRLAAVAAAADPGLSAAVRGIVADQQAQAANARETAHRVEELAAATRELESKFVAVVRADHGFDPPAPPTVVGEHHGNPWGDGGGDGDDSARESL